MGLKELFQRWTKSSDQDALAKTERESQMTPQERELDGEDYEAHKDDVLLGQSYAGSAAEQVVEDEFKE